MPYQQDLSLQTGTDNHHLDSPIPNGSAPQQQQQPFSPSVISAQGSYGMTTPHAHHEASPQQHDASGMQQLVTPSLAIEHDLPQQQQHPTAQATTAAATTATTAVATTTVATAQGDDDLDLLLRHVDFASLLELVVKVKRALAQVAAAKIDESTGQQQPKRSVSSLNPSEVMSAVTRLQEQLLSSTNRGPLVPVPRGVYPITDSIIDDSLSTLQKELDRCLQLIAAVTIDMTGKPPAKKRPRKKEAIAIKYSKWQTDILMNWMIQNKDDPFPDQQDIKTLTQQTGLSQSQVVNWTTNVRKRNRKATCEGGKKPHHFIDFLFLAQDREKKAQVHAPQSKPRHVRSNNGIPVSYHQQDPQAHPSVEQVQSMQARGPPEMPRLSHSHAATEQRYNRPPQHPSSTRVKEQLYSFQEGVMDAAKAPTLEPLAMENMGEVELLDDFSCFWLDDKGVNTLDLDILTDDFGNDFTPDMEDATVNDFIMPYPPQTTSKVLQPLMPSVTDDQDVTPVSTGSSSGNNNNTMKRERSMSVDLEELGDDDIAEWVAEMGMTLEE